VSRRITTPKKEVVAPPPTSTPTALASPKDASAPQLNACDPIPSDDVTNKRIDRILDFLKHVEEDATASSAAHAASVASIASVSADL
jgi:hypothetical protein